MKYFKVGCGLVTNQHLCFKYFTKNFSGHRYIIKIVRTFLGGAGRDLARNSQACLLDRQFPENLLFGQANIFVMNFQF